MRNLIIISVVFLISSKTYCQVSFGISYLSAKLKNTTAKFSTSNGFGFYHNQMIKLNDFIYFDPGFEVTYLKSIIDGRFQLNNNVLSFVNNGNSIKNSTNTFITAGVPLKLKIIVIGNITNSNAFIELGTVIDYVVNATQEYDDVQNNTTLLIRNDLKLDNKINYNIMYNMGFSFNIDALKKQIQLSIGLKRQLNNNLNNKTSFIPLVGVFKVGLIF